MLTSSFIFVRGLAEEQERALWARGITTWEIARRQPGEVAEVVGTARAAKLIEQLGEAEQAAARGDIAWFKANWPERETWRLWRGYCEPAQLALFDIETTGLTVGYDQIIVIGLADAVHAGAFVAGRPEPGDQPLDGFPAALRGRRLLVSFNGLNFDAPFIERHFRSTGFRFDAPHLDLLPLARAMGIHGGLKDGVEPALGITRAADIKEIRGNQAGQLWAQWKAGDAGAYRRLVNYCKADCTNLIQVADGLYQRRWNQVFTSQARTVDFDAVHGKQMSIFG
jgi:uncharacterized protein YprB with RNaseH-like and TPR domain